MKALTKGEALRGRLPSALMSLGVRRPRSVLAVWMLACMASIPGVLSLQVDTSTDSVLDRRHSDWQLYQTSQDLFGGDEIIVIALRSDMPFDPDVIEQIRVLSDQLQDVEGVRRVDSIATVPIVRVDEEGDLELLPALAGAPSEGLARSRHVAKRIMSDRIAPRSLVSEDGRVFAINLVLERGVQAKHAELLAELHAAVDPLGGILSGVPVFRVAANERTSSEIIYFAPLTALLIALFLVAVFRSPIVILIGTAPGIVGSWILLAMMGYMGAPLSITTMVLPSIILALGCAYAMHLLTAASGAATGVALERALRRVALPVALSGLTTVVGFLSITFVRIEAVQFTGAFGALGVLVVTGVSLTLIPAALALHPLQKLPTRGLDWIRGRMGPWLVIGVERHIRTTLVAWTLLTLLLGFGLSRIEVETDATHWLPRGNPVRDSYEEIRHSLSGISPINIMIEAPEGRTVLEPATLVAIDGLSRHLGALDEVGKSIAVTDPLRQLHGELLRDSSQPLPGDYALAEEYLLLLGSVDQMADLITPDRRSANILLRVDNNASTPLLEVANEAAVWWSANGPTDHTLRSTGIMYEFARAENEIAYGQMRGLALALVVISMILFAIFRRPRIALVALLPNAIPLAIIFGCMGLLGVPLDAGTVLIGGLALGVAVDDTIHITSGFCERLEQGDEPRRALLGTYDQVLPAIVFSSIMIAGAFLVLGMSEFTITRNLGLLTAGIMVLCLLSDISLLAALLLFIPLAPTVADPAGLKPRSERLGASVGATCDGTSERSTSSQPSGGEERVRIDETGQRSTSAPS